MSIETDSERQELARVKESLDHLRDYVLVAKERIDHMEETLGERMDRLDEQLRAMFDALEAANLIDRPDK